MAPPVKIEPSYELHVFPAKEVSKYVTSLDDACFLEIEESDTAYQAVTEFAVEFLDGVSSFLVRTRARMDDNDGVIGNAYKLAMMQASPDGALSAQLQMEAIATRAPQVNASLGYGVFEYFYKEECIMVCHFMRGDPVPRETGVDLYRGLVVFADGRCEETKELLEEFVQECVKWHHEKTYSGVIENNRFRLFRFLVRHGHGQWSYGGDKKARGEDTVILRKGLKDEIIADFDDFLSNDTLVWYKKHGIPHRRSYLFCGVAGSGKSSMIKMIAGKYKLNACFLSLATKDMNNKMIIDAISSLPSEALLVLEDVDTLFELDSRAKEGVQVTFSAVLNMLDGIVSGEGRLTIMTTNHVTKLDPSFIRCGRVDRIFEISVPDHEQISLYFKSFYPKASKKIRNKFADIIVGLDDAEKKSMATLQQFFIFVRKDDAEKAVARVGEFYKKYFEARIPNSHPLLYA
eukprot:Plantae.Rhodophyta-Hildenbrandia_rubra.ctg12883.p1 GENE.Plantae.Rhodophyta-Hildenbrandia_rubra.ctg12883~~Plantae.Rhodophyta-Hildenbrandia_rubra.ctg12883.p1  ORF type:complete len:460 (+),score=71.15 Plantae.Rhodophyta-Hildenbrandia_rubra.ctg12883:592-1971(+)